MSQVALKVFAFCLNSSSSACVLGSTPHILRKTLVQVCVDLAAAWKWLEHFSLQRFNSSYFTVGTVLFQHLQSSTYEFYIKPKVQCNKRSKSTNTNTHSDHCGSSRCSSTNSRRLSEDTSEESHSQSRHLSHHAKTAEPITGQSHDNSTTNKESDSAGTHVVGNTTDFVVTQQLLEAVGALPGSGLKLHKYLIKQLSLSRRSEWTEFMSWLLSVV